MLADLGHGSPQVDPVQRRLTLPADDVDSLPAVLSRLREQDDDLVELWARRPTLDEAFLAFTGPEAAQPSTAGLAARATLPAVSHSGEEGASAPMQRHPPRRTVIIASGGTPISLAQDLQSGIVAGVQPVAITIDAAGAVTNGLPAGDLPWQSALWSVVILLVSMAIAVGKYRRGPR